MNNVQCKYCRNHSKQVSSNCKIKKPVDSVNLAAKIQPHRGLYRLKKNSPLEDPLLAAQNCYNGLYSNIYFFIARNGVYTTAIYKQHAS